MKIFSILGLLTACSTELPQKLTEDSAVDDVEGQESEETDTEDTNSSDTTDTNSDDDTSDDGTDVDQTEDTVKMTFRKQTVLTLPGTAWMQPIDTNFDGFDEYLITSMSVGLGDWPTFIGAGAAYIFSRSGGPASGTLGLWSTETAFDRTFEIDWPNDSSIFDVNNDGVDDWVIGTGFIPLPNGGLTWMEGTINSSGSLQFDIPDIIPVPIEEYFYHKAYPVDMDGDDDLDFVTTSYKNAETDWLGNVIAPGDMVLEWFENNGIAGVASFTPRTISQNGGTLLALHDVDEDGDMDIILPQYFLGVALVWLENPSSTTATWTEHVINDNTGRGFDVIMSDMNNDGYEDIVYVNHNHQLATAPDEQTMGVYWFEIPPPETLDGLSNWNSTMNVVYEGFYVDEADPDRNGAPGVTHVGDVDGDGLMDVSVSGDGDDGLYLFKQREDQSFEEILIDTGTEMAGDHHMADLDVDGDMDFIWAIYGLQSIFEGEFEPQSEVNVYLQETAPVGDTLQGNVNFTIDTSFGPDTCNGTVELTVSDSDVYGSYSCNFGILGNQQNTVQGTIDSSGVVNGLIDVTVSFDNTTYQLDWNGTYQNNVLTVSTTESAQLGSIDIDYTLNFTAQ